MFVLTTNKKEHLRKTAPKKEKSKPKKGFFRGLKILLKKPVFLVYHVFGVPRSKSGMVPRSSLLGAGRLGFWGVGKGGTIG
jgi:hypothetical protein